MEMAFGGCAGPTSDPHWLGWCTDKVYIESPSVFTLRLAEWRAIRRQLAAHAEHRFRQAVVRGNGDVEVEMVERSNPLHGITLYFVKKNGKWEEDTQRSGGWVELRNEALTELSEQDAEKYRKQAADAPDGNERDNPGPQPANVP